MKQSSGNAIAAGKKNVWYIFKFFCAAAVGMYQVQKIVVLLLSDANIVDSLFRNELRAPLTVLIDVIWQIRTNAHTIIMKRKM